MKEADLIYERKCCVQRSKSSKQEPDCVPQETLLLPLVSLFVCEKRKKAIDTRQKKKKCTNINHAGCSYCVNIQRPVKTLFKTISSGNL